MLNLQEIIYLSTCLFIYLYYLIIFVCLLSVILFVCLHTSTKYGIMMVSCKSLNFYAVHIMYMRCPRTEGGVGPGPPRIRFRDSLRCFWAPLFYLYIWCFERGKQPTHCSPVVSPNLPFGMQTEYA